MKIIKKIIIIIAITILILQTNVLADRLDDELDFAISMLDQLTEDIKVYTLDGGDIWFGAYKFTAKEKTSNWSYDTTGYVLHNFPTGNTKNTMGDYSSFTKVYDYTGATNYGKKVYSEYYLNDANSNSRTRLVEKGTNTWVRVVDITDFFNRNVLYGDPLYYSAILYVNYRGNPFGPYLKFSDFLNNYGEAPFASGTNGTDEEIVKKAREGYYNKEIKKSDKINITMRHIEIANGERIKIDKDIDYYGVTERQQCIFKPIIESGGKQYYFKQSFYQKVDDNGYLMDGDCGITNNRERYLPEENEAIDLVVFGVYERVATANIHYIVEGGDYTNENDKVLDSINLENIPLNEPRDFNIWTVIDPNDNIMYKKNPSLEKKVYTISNVKISLNYNGEDFHFSAKDGLGEVNWGNLFNNAKGILDGFYPLTNVWSDSTKMVFTPIDNNILTVVIEYKVDAPTIQEKRNVTVDYLYGINAHEGHSSNCLTLSNSTGKLKETDTYTYIKGDNVTGINLPQTIQHGDHTHTLVNSYFENAANDLTYHVDGSYTSRNPGVLNENLHIIAEYDPCELLSDSVPVYVYYFKQKPDGTVDRNNPESIGQSYSSFKLGDYKVGSTATANLPSTYDFSGTTCELKKSYIVNEVLSNPATWVSSKDSSENTNGITTFVTTRNVKIGSSKDIYIVAEYGEPSDQNGKTIYTSYSMRDMDNNARGLIASMDNQYYNVYRGIPSGANIYSQVKANDYLYTMSGYKVTGNRYYTVTVNVNFTFNYKCQGCECPGHDEPTYDAEGNVTGSRTVYDDCDGYCPGHTYTSSYTYTYDDINRTFEFYTIGQYEVFNISKVFLRNPLLNKANNGFSMWNGNTVSIAKNINSDFDTHVKFHYDDTFAKTITLDGTDGTYNLTQEPAKGNNPVIDYSSYKDTYWTAANNSIEEIEVKNDTLTVDGQVLLGGGNFVNTTAVAPSTSSTKSGDEIIYRKSVSNDKEFIERDINIPVMQANGKYETTENKIRYVSQEAFGQDASNDIVTDIDGFKENSALNNWVDIDGTPNRNKVNDVAVHTPVYIDITVDKNNTFNQALSFQNNGDNSDDRMTVALDKSFDIHFDVKGRNRNIKAYNNENTIWTEKWIKQVPQIKFPFDCYVKTSNNGDTMLCKANTWYDVTDFACGYTGIGDTGGTITVTVPVWTKEGTYSGTNGIVMRVIAQNDQVPANKEHIGLYGEGNWNRSNPDDSSVEGTISYANSIVDSRTNDQLTLNVVGRVYDFKFTYTDDSNYANEFKTGSFVDRMINRLPYAQKGDNPTNSYATALRLGSKIRYDLKTKGEASANVQVVPTFYWVSKDGGALQKVDVYYLNNGKREKLTTATGLTEKITLQAQSEMNKNNYNLLTNQEIGHTKTIGRVSNNYGYGSVTEIGKTGKIWLGKTERLAYDIITGNDTYAKNYGKNQTVDKVKTDGGFNNILKANSHWYGQFTLPQNAWFVAEGGNVNNAIDKEGYVIVYFNIVTKKEGEGTAYLSYQAPESNTQWQKEGWTAGRTITLPNGKTTIDLSTSTNFAGIAIYDANVNKDGSRNVITH